MAAEAVSSSEISVQWSGLSNCRLVNGRIVSYRVQFTANGTTESRDWELGDGGDWRNGGEISLTGLNPLTNYSIAVAAVNENGDIGIYSDPVMQQTLEVSGECVVEPETSNVMCAVADTGEQTSVNAGGIAAGVIIAVLIVVIAAVIIGVLIWW